MTKIISAALAAAVALALATPLSAATVVATMYLAGPTGVGDPVGRVVFRDAAGGATIKVTLYRLSPGRHGFHIHQNPSCGPGPVDGVSEPAGGAGAHYDPMGTGKHMGPTGKGHLGDLPILTVAADLTDHETLTAPRITDVTQLKGHALVIHAGGDNYADEPKPLGGGGARIACGVIS
jgi:Cu-Zn family superoxide dismutase